jgi:hypothetical protein
VRRVMPAIHGSGAGAPTPPLGPIGPPGETPSVPQPPPLLGVWGTTTEEGDEPPVASLDHLVGARDHGRRNRDA